MRRLVALMAFASVAIAPLSTARAGVYGDDLSRCLVKSTTTDDQMAFMVWMFSALGAHPAVKGYTTFTDAQREAASAKAAALMQRLILEDCRKESVAAIRYEGETAVYAGFNTFGQAAVRDLMNDPAVGKNMSALEKHIDPSRFESLAKEAGLPSK
jgi:hypothetical protein